MAQRRMFSLKIIDTDEFLNMPVSSRLLYYDLAMRADDDGFVSGPKRIMKIVGATEDDFKVLCAKQFIIPFKTGICVIKDWKIHNYIQKDRYQETHYKNEKKQLKQDENGSYTCKQNVSIMDTQDVDTQVRIGKVRIGQGRIGEVRLGKVRNKKFVIPELSLVSEYFTQNGYTAEAAKKFLAYYAAGDWNDSNGKPVKSWKQKAQAVWFKPENKAPEAPQPKDNHTAVYRHWHRYDAQNKSFLAEKLTEEERKELGVVLP